MSDDWSSPIRAANKLSKVLKLFSDIHQRDRFPVDVKALALSCADQYGWSDPITEVKAVDITGLEGGLFQNSDKNAWMLLYNQKIRSPGRIRFTQAHELGHYLLHRSAQQQFECSKEDMLNWNSKDKKTEDEADQFASYLLMPLDDYRLQLSSVSSPDLEVFSHCANRYGVSLVAVILKWLEYTSEKAVLIMSNNGFMEWSCSSDAAYKNGAVFKTRGQVVPIPENTLTSDERIIEERLGQKTSAKSWFQYAHPELSLREMKLYSHHYESTITLLILPKSAYVGKFNNY